MNIGDTPGPLVSFLPTYLSSCLLVCLCICPSVLPFVFLSVCLSVCLSVYVHLSPCLSVCLPPLHLPICMKNRLDVYAMLDTCFSLLLLDRFPCKVESFLQCPTLNVMQLSLTLFVLLFDAQGESKYYFNKGDKFLRKLWCCIGGRV